MVCSAKHKDYWYSSQIYGSGFAINYVLDTALIVSGGQIKQFQRSVYRNQRLYAIPTIEQEFVEMRASIVQKRQSRLEPVILCGDCQLDSPGWSATKGAHTFMDYTIQRNL